MVVAEIIYSNLGWMILPIVFECDCIPEHFMFYCSQFGPGKPEKLSASQPKPVENCRGNVKARGELRPPKAQKSFMSYQLSCLQE